MLDARQLLEAKISGMTNIPAKWNTPWIWLIIFLPVLLMFGFLSFPWSNLVNVSDTTGVGMLSFIASPTYLLTVFGGWVIYGLSAWFAYLDWRELQKRGVPQPFHFGWVFLSGAVYAIGRSVVVNKRIGRGISPMWVQIAVLVLEFGLAIYISIEVFITAFSAFYPYR